VKQDDLLALGQSASEAEFKANLQTAVESMDFGFFTAILRLGPVDSTKRANKIINNTPDAFLVAAMDPKSARADPGFKLQMRQSLPFSWDQKFYARHGAAPAWDTQSSFGYKVGLCASLHMPAEQQFLMSMDRPDDLPEDPNQLTRLLAEMQLMTMYASAAALRLFPLIQTQAKNDAPSGISHKLTPREVEVLKWAMAGKSSWSTGEILCMSENTVKFHMKNIYQKLGASSRSQAVIRGLELGII